MICSVLYHTSYTFLYFYFPSSCNLLILFIYWSRLFMTTLRYCYIYCFRYSSATSSCLVFYYLNLSSLRSMSCIFLGSLAVWLKLAIDPALICCYLVLKCFYYCGWIKDLSGIDMVVVAAFMVSIFFLYAYFDI